VQHRQHKSEPRADHILFSRHSCSSSGKSSIDLICSRSMHRSMSNTRFNRAYNATNALLTIKTNKKYTFFQYKTCQRRT
jgi:hypothetical protein